jgi:serine/threonine-protein kinase
MNSSLRDLMAQGAQRARVYDVVARAQRLGERRRRRRQVMAVGLCLVAVAGVGTAASLVVGRPDSAPVPAASTGTAEQTVPLSVIDLPQDQAKTLLEGLGFVPAFESTDGAAKAGNVVRTDPAAGQTVPAGSPITVYVSKGNFEVVPGLVGQDGVTARTLLQYCGFTAQPEVLYQITTDPTRIGKVVYQTPTTDTEMDPSRPVRIVIGKAPPIA